MSRSGCESCVTMNGNSATPIRSYHFLSAPSTSDQPLPSRCCPQPRRSSTTGSCACGRPTAKRPLSLRACASSTHPRQARKSSRTSSSQAHSPSSPLHVHGLFVDSDSAGIGSFTILDEKIANGEDVGVSFFLEEMSIGRPRCEAACALISEMNPDVRGTFVNQVPHLNGRVEH
jgi:hypothetical protein